jgi:thioredoxin reductase
MCVHEEQDSTTSFGIFLTWSLWPQRTIFATGANYENLGNDKHLTVVMHTTARSDAATPVRDDRVASAGSNEAAAHETTTVPGWSSNDR